MTIQHITLAGVKSACRLAHAEGRLAAQNTAEYPSYYYRNSAGYGCAIGVALTQETVDKMDSQNWTIGIDGEELAQCFSWPGTENEELVAIQIAHDNWHRSKADSFSEDNAAEMESAFLVLIIAAGQ